MPVLGVDDLIELKERAGRDKDLFDVQQVKEEKMTPSDDKADPYHPFPDRVFSGEEIIEWLDGYRQLMFEIWASNPSLRDEWDRINK